MIRPENWRDPSCLQGLDERLDDVSTKTAAREVGHGEIGSVQLRVVERATID